VVSFADPALVELLAAPFDFAWIDLEHSALTVADVQVLAIAMRAAGCAALVRLPGTDPERLPAMVDAGIEGVVAPRVETAADAGALATRLRHPPAGQRGFAHRRWSDYGRRLTAEPPALIVQIESAAAVGAARDIAAVDGVDALVVGTADLSLDLGLPPTPVAPELRTAMTAVQEAAAEAGIASGIAAGGKPEEIAPLLAGGSTLLVFAADARLYASAADAAAAAAARTLSAIVPEQERPVL